MQLKALRVAVVALFALGVAVALRPIPDITGSLVERPDIEVCLVGAVGHERADAGVPALAVHDRLVASARRHASAMAADGEMRHSNLRANYGPEWKLVGENVATNADVATCGPMATGLANSEGHRSNTVDARWRFVGAGAVETDGVLWAAVAFAQPHGAGQVPATTTPAAAPPPVVTTPPPPPPVAPRTPRPTCTCP